MKNLSFAESRYVELMINGDPDRVIRFDPSDYNIVKRLNEAQAALNDINTDGEAIDVLMRADAAVRHQIDKVFGAPVADIAFGVTNALTPVDEDGTMLFEAFLQAVVPEIVSAVEKRQQGAKSRVDQYLKPYTKE